MSSASLARRYSRAYPDGTETRPGLFRPLNAGIFYSGAVYLPPATVRGLAFTDLPLFVSEEVLGCLTEYRTHGRDMEHAPGGQKGIEVVFRMLNSGFITAGDTPQVVSRQSTQRFSICITHGVFLIRQLQTMVLHRWPITFPCLRPFDLALCSCSAPGIASGTMVWRGCEQPWSTM